MGKVGWLRWLRWLRGIQLNESNHCHACIYAHLAAVYIGILQCLIPIYVNIWSLHQVKPWEKTGEM
jgi:hypothetical protein